jgi:hypothetical protein
VTPTDLLPLAGRTVDLALGDLDRTGAGALAVLAGGDGRGEAVAGPLKLAGRAAATLLTPVGSLRFDPARGTGLLPAAFAGGWRTAADVARTFAGARLDLLRQLRRLETAADPADERVGDVTLGGVTVDPAAGAVALVVVLTTAAGTPVPLLVPVPVTPR